jgi:DNA-binding IclR family transcriptional regulator
MKNSNELAAGDLADQLKPTIDTIARAAKILNCIGNGINSINDIVDSSDLSKSTVYRFLKALGEEQLLFQDPKDRRYYFGPLITRFISSPQKSHEYLITCSFEEMRSLSRITNETINLEILVGLKHFSLRTIPSTHDLRVVENNQGNREDIPLYMGAAQKVLLSQLSAKDLKMTVKHIHFEPEARGAVDREEVLLQLKRIRKQGYAISFSEIIVGATCISAPVNNYIFPVSLSVLGPEGRMKPRLEEFLNDLTRSASLISKNISRAF